jgi:hypothetical protein
MVGCVMKYTFMSAAEGGIAVLQTALLKIKNKSISEEQCAFKGQ